MPERSGMPPSAEARRAAAALLGRFAPPRLEYAYGQDFCAEPYKGDFDGECIWISDRVQGCFYQCSPEGALLARHGRPGSEPREIGRPISVRVAPDGTVHLCDILNCRLDRYDRSGRFLETVREGRFSDVVFDAARGRMYLADVDRYAVLALDLSAPGRILDEIRLPDWVAGEVLFGLQLRGPDELLILTEARLFAAGLDDAPGTRARHLTARYKWPLFRGLTVLDDGDIVVCNTASFNIPTLVRYTADGSLVSESPLVLGGRHAAVVGAFLVRGALHVTCMAMGRIAVLDLSGREAQA